jgi:hypothetical protein
MLFSEVERILRLRISGTEGRRLARLVQQAWSWKYRDPDEERTLREAYLLGAGVHAA